MIELAVATIGVVTGVVTIFTTFAKLQSMLSRFETRDLELRDEIRQLKLQLEYASDRLTLIANGLKERIEHVNTRLTGQMKETANTINGVEAYLQKNTSYERRGS